MTEERLVISIIEFQGRKNEIVYVKHINVIINEVKYKQPGIRTGYGYSLFKLYDAHK